MRKPLGKRGVDRKTNQQATGKIVGRRLNTDINANPHTSKAPVMAIRWLFSCGYKAGTLRTVSNGWMRTEVVDRVSGADRGVRWIRPKIDGHGYEVRSVEPA